MDWRADQHTEQYNANGKDFIHEGGLKVSNIIFLKHNPCKQTLFFTFVK